jgi:NAD(P)-dependent dehydrogenase (short-subunit alcohol dehydrogenase family)
MPLQSGRSHKFIFNYNISTTFFFTISMVSINRYTAAHQSPKGAGDARPTAQDILKDEGLEGKLADKVFLVTGASAGLGVETVKVLATTGATIFAAARDLKKAKKALEGIPGNIQLLEVDLASLNSVRAAADRFLAKSSQLNVLVNNAGMTGVPTRTLTADGFEAIFETNYLGEPTAFHIKFDSTVTILGHFLLFQLLKPTLLASSSSTFHSRVITLTSSAHRHSPVLFGDYNFENNEYDTLTAYGQAKTATLYMASAIERYYGSQGLHGLAVHPGTVVTGLTRDMNPAMLNQVMSDPSIVHTVKSVPQGAAITVLAAVSGQFEGIGGKYLEDASEGSPGEDRSPFMMAGYASWAFDPEKEDRL